MLFNAVNATEKVFSCSHKYLEDVKKDLEDISDKLLATSGSFFSI